MTRLCLVGHFTSRPDEGVRNLAANLAVVLAKKHTVTTVNILDPLAWIRVRTFRPDIIHYIISPTVGGLLLARVIAGVNPGARTVVSAPHPARLPNNRWMAWLKPDLVLVQSDAAEKMFRQLGYRTHFLPNGVDTVRFAPVAGERKRALMQKYGIAQEKFVILHVASLKRGRNLEVLAKLQQDRQNQVVIIGRQGEKRDENLVRELKEAGCLVITEYLPEIEQLYALADCYVFPTLDHRYCIETPLSVLEALACNLPVVTTPFGALPRLFSEGGGLTFARQEAGIIRAVNAVKVENQPVRTREKVLAYGWEELVQQLEAIYRQITI